MQTGHESRPIAAYQLDAKLRLQSEFCGEARVNQRRLRARIHKERERPTALQANINLDQRGFRDRDVREEQKKAEKSH